MQATAHCSLEEVFVLLNPSFLESFPLADLGALFPNDTLHCCVSRPLLIHDPDELAYSWPNVLADRQFSGHPRLDAQLRRL